MRSLLVGVVLSVGLAARARGQSVLGSASALRMLPIAGPAMPSDAKAPPLVDAVTLSRYLSYGGIIGIAGGLAWGAMTEHRQTRVLDIAGDAAIGWVIGMAGGAVAYVVHEGKQ